MSESTEKEPEKRRWSLFPKTLSSCIEPLARPVLKSQGLAGTRLLTEWESIAGSTMSRHSIPQKINFPRGKTTGGTLYVAIENGFATEWQHSQPQIMERIAVYFGYQAINRIAISHSYEAPEKAPKKKHTGHLQLDTSVVESVEDDELKSALSSFANSLAKKE